MKKFSLLSLSLLASFSLVACTVQSSKKTSDSSAKTSKSSEASKKQAESSKKKASSKKESADDDELAGVGERTAKKVADKASSEAAAAAARDAQSKSAASSSVPNRGAGHPTDASNAPKDKIYSTSDEEVYYHSDKPGSFEAGVPEYKGYNLNHVKNLLGDPEGELEASSFKDSEAANLRGLIQAGKITENQARAFMAMVVDNSLVGGFKVYKFKSGSILVAISNTDGHLIYITPDTDFVSF